MKAHLASYSHSQTFIHLLARHSKQIVNSVRLVKKFYDGDVLCVYCRNILESHDHLIFECSFACRIWS